ncbi:MAG: hypothetical protein PHP50_08330 [Lachnospiraceae bacterium]|nr:hypothetical protein [Lachnospiraceae bacterium]
MKKSKRNVALGVAFVGFVTQFGGGFASGTQIYQYFINYGIWALLMPLFAQFVLSLFYWYGMRYAYRHHTYNYRSFSDSFYGKFKGLFSNLYEIEYVVMVCMAPAVAFATGGATLNALTGLPYILCTVIIGVFIFIVTVFGTDIVRKCSSVLSVIIIIGLVLILVPNIIVQWDTIMTSVGNLSQGIMPVGSKASGSFGSAFWRACIYGIFQLTAVGLMYQHTRGMASEKDVAKSMIYMFIVDAAIMELAIVGLLAVAYLPELAEVSVPMLLLVQKGAGAKFFTPLISVLVILGAVSTGVNMIAGIVERTVNQIRKNNKSKLSQLFVTLLFTIITFAIAQFGLIPLVQKGYSYIGYATLFVIVIPFVLHFVMHIGKKEEV